MLPGVELIEADVHDEQQLAVLVEGCDAVISLSGILNEGRGKNNSFRQVHVELTRKIIAACQGAGVKRLLHMSALNASVDGTSQYLRTKGEAERLVHAATDIHVTSFRPSVIFGPGDSFFNRFAQLLRISPVLPLACARSQFSPVFVGDVVEAMALTLTRADYYGKTLELGGPRIYTLQQLVAYTASCLGISRAIVPLADPLSRLQAVGMDAAGFLFNLVGMEKPFSTDNYLSLQTDSICTTDDLVALGITASSIETVVPTYLASTGSRSRYDTYRRQARRRL